MKNRVQQKRRPTPSTVGTTPTPGKQVEAPATSVTASVTALQQARNAR